MNNIQLILSVSTIHLLASMRPGPNIFLCTKIGLSGDRHYVLAVAAGIATGALIHVLLGILGFTAIIVSSPTIYQTSRVIFASYLVFLGLKAIYLTKKPIIHYKSDIEHFIIRTFYKAFTLGLMTMLLNIMAATHFIGLFTIFIPHNAPTHIKIILVIILPIITFAWFYAIAIAFSSKKIREMTNRFKTIVDITFGAIMISIGVSVIFSTYL